VRYDDRVVLVIALFIMSLVGIILKGKLNTLREEAVKRGYAEWVVDASGETEWRWKGGSDE